MDIIPAKEKVELVLKHEENEDQGIEITLRDVIQTVINGKWLIAAIVIVCLIITAIGSAFMPYKGQVRAIISFNFDGIEKGLDPYGKAFDVSKIKSPVVIDKVVETLNLKDFNISSDDIRLNLNIEPVIPGDVTQKIKELQEAKKQNVKDLQDFTYYPNTYMITFNLHKSFGLKNKKAEEVLNEIVKQYKEYFYYSYSDRAVLSNVIGNIDYNEYDYPEISTVIHNQIDIIRNYLYAKNNESDASVFRSKKTGLAFNDIIDTVSVIERVDLNRIDSIIDSYNLTKDKDKLIKLYEYRVQTNTLTSQKKNSEANVYGNLLNKYQKDKNIFLVPGLAQGEGSNSTVETDESSKYYDDLIDKSSSAGIESKNDLHDSEYYKKQIKRLENDNVPTEVKKSAEKDILKLIPEIKAKLENWIKLTNDTVLEYYDCQLTNKAISSISPATYSGGSKNIRMFLAVALAIGLLIGLFAAFIREYWRKSTPAKNLTE